ncbi:MAG TPA: phosphotransferase [Rhizomicrobium sp.]|nr:phosphotransferase [Rhizomicrobium sp.]
MSQLQGERDARMKDFLARSGWGDAVVTPLPGDASSRRYARLSDGARKAMLMDQPQGAEAPIAPPGASPEQRASLGYNAVARLAGADCARFAAAAAWLRGQGLAAPQIHAADHAQGFVILEDLGDDLFANVLASGGDERALYRAAVEVLAAIHLHDAPLHLPPPSPSGARRAGEADLRFPLFEYDAVALIAETDLLTEWFLPLALGRTATKAEVSEHRRLWAAALAGTGASRRVFVHRDYHAQNLLWLPERDGVARVGLIDFQDAVAGSAAYDLISLTEDARRDVSPTLAADATAHYLAAMRAQGTPLDEAAFHKEMAVMAAQRNAKIVGIFARLYKRDGKARYLNLLPRVWGYLERDLQHPALGDLSAWYDGVIPADKRAVTL